MTDRDLGNHWPFHMIAAEKRHGIVLVLRFGVVGVLNTAFGYLAFAVCILIGLWPSLALVLSTIAGVLFNFQTSRRLVFRTSGHGRLLRFFCVYAILLMLNWIALRTAHAHGINDLAAQAALALPIAVLSFICQKLFVFGPAADAA